MLGAARSRQWAWMRITFLGHAGLYLETRHGSILCDPWFTPAYFGSWFPFPRNDGLDPAAFAHPDYLYISHSHRDHFDPDWLARHVDKRARVLLPDFNVPFLERELRAIGFHDFVATANGELHDLDGLQIAILAMTEPADGPLGDSAIVIDDGTARILDQNDARLGNPDELHALGPFDAQMVQFSGAIWYPVAYDFPPAEKTAMAREKRVNEMARAQQYVEWVDAHHVFPCAGPPAFLDGDLFALNDLDRDPANIFPDQTVFLDQLADAGIDNAHLIVPGSVIDLEDAACKVTHPDGDDTIDQPFGATKRAYLEQYQRDWLGWLEAERAGWSSTNHDLVGELAPWFEPILERAPITSAGIAGNVVLDVGDPQHNVCIDFVESQVRRWQGHAREPYVYKVDVDRRLIDALIARRTEDWVNSLFLSCRFTAHRDGPFNEFVMTFFKALSPDRIAYVERSYREARRRADEFFQRDGWRIERWCPHRQADLTSFAEISDGILTCSLHHWQFELETGRCLTSDAKHLRCERVRHD
jgi:UDP-MurNAc hydroxylase